MFPVYLAKNGFVPPEKGIYYVVAKDGIYMRTERLHGSCMVKVGSIPHLDAVECNPTFVLPKIPAHVMRQAKLFFKTVFDVHHSESYLTLLYSAKLQTYKLWCPEQSVTYTSVDYNRADTVPVEDRNYIGSTGDAWQMVGTIHSHCDFSAFHSGTDEADEASFDGIHLTFGHVNQDRFSISVSTVFSNNRTKMNPVDVADGILFDMEEMVQEEEEEVRGWYKRTYTVQRIENWHIFAPMTSEEELAHIDFEVNVLPEWLKKVSKKYVSSHSCDTSPSSDSSTSSSDWVDMWRNQKYSRGQREFRFDSRGFEDYYGMKYWDGD